MPLFPTTVTVAIHGKIPAWIGRLLLPKLNVITGEIKALHTRIDSVEKEVVGLRREMLSKFEARDSRFDSLEARIPVMEKMAEFEVRLADCEAF